mmetsp:Transcript_40756/g.85366  ORF Transcript_40756/g.85366 Transcript_40756/m.85366 type:complete len:782 (+) Transcript_40756:991-3336(+)
MTRINNNNNNNNGASSLGSRNRYASSDDTAYSALPKTGLSIKLAPKNPVQRRSPRRHRPKLSPRKNRDSSARTTASLSKHHLSPMSPLHPPRNLRSNNGNDYFGDFTLTPTVLYSNNHNNQNHTNNNGQGGPQSHNYNRRQAPMSATTTTPQYYHQSPHWSGQVRVNPFSPVPEQFLHHPPPTSTKSATRGTNHHTSGRKRHYTGRYAGFYNWDALEGPPTLPTGEIGEPLSVPPKKRARSRLNPVRSTRARSAGAGAAIPRLDDFEDGISPTDVTRKDAFDDEATAGGSKRKTPPRSANSNDWRDDDRGHDDHDDRDDDESNDGNKRMRLPERGRYLSDFQEVQFLGAGSFGSVNACLSRLDGCMYAVKSISPAGVRRGGMGDSSVPPPGTEGGEGAATADAAGGGVDCLYGGRRTRSDRWAIPPTPRRDAWMLTPQRRKKAVSRFAAGDLDSAEEDCGDDLGVLEGSGHWNDGALRRMLREVFALAALCQQDDFRTFHIVRYQQAWLEDDGTLYIQTELCSATLRDELSGKQVVDGSANGGGSALKSILHNTTTQSSSAATNATAMDVFRQIKVLREVLLALELVHQRGMVHLDIKPENIMVKNNLYKLGDFGLANSFTKNEGKAGATNITPDIEEGDSRYMSKDLLDFRPKDLTKCDIFSLGATMYEICTGLPLPSCGQEWQGLRNGRLPCPFPSSTMPCLASIVKEMMHPDPERRPSATELLAREVLSGSLGGGKSGVDAGNPLLRGPARNTPLYKMGGVAEPVRLNRPSLKRSASF